MGNSIRADTGAVAIKCRQKELFAAKKTYPRFFIKCQTLFQINNKLFMPY